MENPHETLGKVILNINKHSSYLFIMQKLVIKISVAKLKNKFFFNFCLRSCKVCITLLHLDPTLNCFKQNENSLN